MRLRVLLVVGFIGCSSPPAAPLTPASVDAGFTTDVTAADLPVLDVVRDLGAPPDLAIDDLATPIHDMRGPEPMDLANHVESKPSDLAIALDFSMESLDFSTPTPPDLTGVMPPDLRPPPPPDLAAADMAYRPPSSDDTPVVHAPPSPMSGAVTRLGGLNVLDVSTDKGGGVWAVTSDKVFYFPPGSSSPRSYDQSNGLARGWYTWEDKWFSPGTYPVTFASVSGSIAGQAVVGNIGAIADRVVVNSSTGSFQRVDNLEVTSAQVEEPELSEHKIRVVAGLRVYADVDGVYEGTAYIGGFHGFYAFHGLRADCNCLAFEEHVHWITDTQIGGGDGRALAMSPYGDVWMGDNRFISLLPQRSRGSRVGLFDYILESGTNVFPDSQFDERDENFGIGVDAAGGVYVASYGKGLAYLAPMTLAPRYWSSASGLPQNRLTDVQVDGAGSVWIATVQAGVARLDGGQFTYYTTASGLASNGINRIHVDRFAGGARVIYFATRNGLTIWHP